MKINFEIWFDDDSTNEENVKILKHDSDVKLIYKTNVGL